MTDRLSDRDPIGCARLRRSSLFQLYLDGELPVAETLEVQLHLDRCAVCGQAAEEERAFHRRLRQQVPRVVPSGDLHERVRHQILRLDRRERVGRYLWRLAWAMPGSAAVLAILVWGLGVGSSRPDLVKALVSNHRLYSRLEAPAELASDSLVEVAGWLRRQFSVSVPVPDFSQAGLRLIGARRATHAEHPVAHVLYEKGRTLVSLYILPASDLSLPRRGWTTLDGHEVLIRESTGHQVVLGRSGRFVFALVSTLDREALLECTRVFLREGGRREATAKGQPPRISFLSSLDRLGRAEARASSPVPGL